MKNNSIKKIKKIFSQMKILRDYASYKACKDENAFCFDKIKTLDSETGKLKITIHSIEKAILKVGTCNEILNKRCANVIDDAEKLITKYGVSIKSDIIRETVGITKLCLKTNINKSADLVTLQSKFDNFCTRFNISDSFASIEIVFLKKHVNNINFSQYEEFIKTRHSIRFTSDEVIPKSEIKEVISVAQKCPSACNRQSTLVYYSQDFASLRWLLPDPLISKDIKNFLIVCVNKSYYSSNELYLPWIDGGIFLESLILSLHAKEIGTCVFKYLKNSNRYKKLKIILNIPKNIDIVAFVGYGRLKDEYPVINTHRKDVEEVFVNFSNQANINGGQKCNNVYSSTKIMEYAA